MFEHFKRIIVDLKFSPKWLKGKYISINLEEEEEESTTRNVHVAFKVIIVASPANPTWFNQRQVENLSSFIDSHNHVIAQLRSKVKVIQENCA